MAIEKKALQGVFEGPCLSAGVRLSPFKGSPSLTFLYEIGQEMEEEMELNGNPKSVILYYGDHDPTGMNIPEAAMNTILWEIGFPDEISLKRCGLNKDQALELGLPPDPAKLTDSRAAGYIREFGSQCWELDAVPPAMLQEWCAEDIAEYFDLNTRRQVRAEDRERTERYQEKLIEEARRILDELEV